MHKRYSWVQGHIIPMKKALSIKIELDSFGIGWLGYVLRYDSIALRIDTAIGIPVFALCCLKRLSRANGSFNRYVVITSPPFHCS